MGVIEVDIAQLKDVIKEQNFKPSDAEMVEALCNAAYYNQIEVIKYLLAYGVRVNSRTEDDRTPLDYAIENESIEAFTFLIDAGADVNGRNTFFDLPLFHAIDIEVEASHSSYNKPADATMTQFLINHGADVNLKGGDGQTLLEFAIRRGHKKAEALIRAELDRK